jgi:hypothetical protein
MRFLRHFALARRMDIAVKTFLPRGQNRAAITMVTVKIPDLDLPDAFEFAGLGGLYWSGAFVDLEALV